MIQNTLLLLPSCLRQVVVCLFIFGHSEKMPPISNIEEIANHFCFLWKTTRLFLFCIFVHISGYSEKFGKGVAVWGITHMTSTQFVLRVFLLDGSVLNVISSVGKHP